MLSKFLSYIRRNIPLLLFSFLVAGVTYGVLLLHADDVLTDSEVYITHTRYNVEFFAQVGRAGITLTKKLFSTDTYIPFVFISFMMLTMTAIPLFVNYMVEEIAETEYKPLFEGFSYIFSGLFISCPIFLHQYYFYYQAFEVAFALLLGVIGSFCAYRYVYRKEKWYFLLGAVVCMVWSFATYQVLVPYVIAVNAFIFVLEYLYGRTHESYLKICAQVVMIFIISLIGYFVFSKVYLLVMGYEELTGQGVKVTDSYLYWGKIPVRECLRGIAIDLWRVVVHEPPVFSKFYVPITACFAGLGVIKGFKKGHKQFPLYLAALLILIMSPFFMAILLGNPMIVRGQLVYPFVLAITAGLLLVFVHPYSFVKILYSLILLVALCSQIDISNGYGQMVHAVYEADVKFASEVQRRKENVLAETDQAFADTIPMVFVGSHTPGVLPCYMPKWDATGISFFEIDSDKYSGSVRISRFMSSIGIPAIEPTPQQYDYAVQRSSEIPVWPDFQSVVYDAEENLVIVHLSD